MDVSLQHCGSGRPHRREVLPHSLLVCNIKALLRNVRLKREFFSLELLQLLEVDLGDARAGFEAYHPRGLTNEGLEGKISLLFLLFAFPFVCTLLSLARLGVSALDHETRSDVLRRGDL